MITNFSIQWNCMIAIFSIKWNCMIGVFALNQNVVFSVQLYFLKQFGFCLQQHPSDKDLGYSEHQRLDGLAFTMHRKRPEFSSSCLAQMI